MRCPNPDCRSFDVKANSFRRSKANPNKITERYQCNRCGRRFCEYTMAGNAHHGMHGEPVH